MTHLHLAPPFTLLFLHLDSLRGARGT